MIRGAHVATAVALIAACGDAPRAGAAGDSVPLVAVNPAPAPDTSVGPARWRMTAHGIGPVAAGMTLSEAAVLIGPSPPIAPGDRECSYVRAPAHQPVCRSWCATDHRSHPRRSANVSTVEGATVGTTEETLRALYAAE